MKQLLLPFAALLSASLGLGCGGDDSSDVGSGGASCNIVAACGGGDVTGSWQITSFCPDKSDVPGEVQDLCKTATLDYDTPTVSGTLEFKDGTFTQTASAKGTGYVVMGRSCIEDNNVTCAQAEELINKKSGGPQVSCKASSGGGCRCAVQIDQSNVTDSGKFTTAGTTLTLTGGKGKPLDSSYCLQSNKLYLTFTLDAAADAYGFTGQLELTKK
jgi:hypothetical protein